MTREEVINAARVALEEATRSETAVCYLTSEDKEWLEIAIKALEQESVLDKIRAEIIDTGAYVIANDSVIQGIIHERDKILETINKYRKSEGE